MKILFNCKFIFFELSVSQNVKTLDVFDRMTSKLEDKLIGSKHDKIIYHFVIFD